MNIIEKLHRKGVKLVEIKERNAKGDLMLVGYRRQAGSRLAYMRYMLSKPVVIEFADPAPETPKLPEQKEEQI